MVTVSILVLLFVHNRSLPSWTLLAVLWQMCHVWISNWIVSGSVLVIGRPSYTKGKFGSLHVFRGFMADLPCLEHLRISTRAILTKNRQCYKGNYASHVTESCKTDGHMRLKNMLLKRHTNHFFAIQ